MSAVGGSQDAPRWLSPRSVSARSHGSVATLGSPLQAASPRAPSCHDSGLLSPGSRAESGPLVAWPEEDGCDSPTLLQELLQPRRGATPSASAVWSGLDPSGAEVLHSGSSPLASRVHSDSRFAGPQGSASVWRARSKSSPKEPDPDSDPPSPSPNGGTSSATERRRPSSSMSALSLRLGRVRADGTARTQRHPQSPPGGGGGASGGASVSHVLSPSAVTKKVFCSSSSFTGTPPESPSGDPATTGEGARSPELQPSHSADPGPVPAALGNAVPTISTAVAAVAAVAAGYGVPGPGPERLGFPAPGSTGRRAYARPGLEVACTPGDTVVSYIVRPVPAGSYVGGPSRASRHRHSELASQEDGPASPQRGGGSGFAPPPAAVGGSRRRWEGSVASTEGFCEVYGAGASGRTTEQQQQQPQPQQQQEQRPGRRARKPLVDAPESGADAQRLEAEPEAGAAGGAGGSTMGSEGHRPQRAAATRHPPILRVAIGLLPSPQQSPAATMTPSPRGTPAPGVNSANLTAAASPAAAAMQLLLASRPRRATAEAVERAPAAPAAALGPHSAPSASLLPPTLPPVQGLPSFLGAPVVLDSPPPHVLAAGPGTPGPGLGPSLSRSTSGADRALSSSTSLAALLAVAPAPSHPPGQSPDSVTSGRNRLQHGSSISRRSINGRTSFHRSGSYFRVREAVPEAVLDNIPGMQAARGLPPQPQHPGAVPEDWPQQQQHLSLTAAAAAPDTGGNFSCSTAGGLLSQSNIGGISIRRYGLDPALASAASGGGGGGGQRPAGRAASNGSSPQSTMSGGSGAAPGTYSQVGAVGCNASWLRRAEAMPPADMLPIAQSPPPLALANEQPASALSTWLPRNDHDSGADGLDGLGAVAAMAAATMDEQGLAGSYGAWPGVSGDDGWRQPGSVAPSETAAAAVPAAAAMAAAAVASSLSLSQGQLGVTSALFSYDGQLSEGQLHSPLSYGSGRRSNTESAASVSAAPSPAPSPHSLSLAAAPPAPQRHTFRSQSKLRLMNLGGLGLGGGGDGAAQTAAATCEQEALLAMLGSSRMLSSVLTATTSGNRGGVSYDPAVHGVRDPRYDHAAHFEMIPEHTVPSATASSSTVAVGGGGGGGGALMGNSRMGSTVFSPPVPVVTKLASSFRRTQRTRSGAGGGRLGGGGGKASRAAMPDLQFLSRRVGATAVVGPNGRTIHLMTKGSASDTQLELPPPEDLVASVNGHDMPRSPLRWGPAGGGGGGGGGGSRIWRRGFTPSLTSTATGGGGGNSSTFRSDGALAPVAASSDESDDGRLPDRARRARSFKALAVQSGTQATRGSSSGISQRGSRPSGGSRGVVPSLIRHLSAPARRLTLTSASGLTPTGATHSSGQSTLDAGRGGHGGHGGRGLGRKPSFIAAGIRFLKRAFTLLPTSPHSHADGHSWHTHSNGDDGRRSPFNFAQPTTKSDAGSQTTAGGRGGAAAGSSGENPWSGSHPDTTAVASPTSRRKLLASQRSFVKHSAVLGWVQPAGAEEDGTTESEVECESSSVAAATSRTVTSSSVARLHSLQSLMATGGGQLTCDAVVAFGAGDGGAGDGGEGAAAARRRRTVARATNTYSRRGGFGALDDASEDARASGSGITTGDGAAVSGVGGGGGGWMMHASSPLGGATALHSSPGGDGGEGARGGLASPPSQRGDGFGALVSAGSPGGQPSSGPERQPSATLMARLGSKLGRSMKRSSMVIPLLDPDRDSNSGALRAEDLDPPSGYLSVLGTSGLVMLGSPDGSRATIKM